MGADLGVSGIRVTAVTIAFFRVMVMMVIAVGLMVLALGVLVRFQSAGSLHPGQPAIRGWGGLEQRLAGT